MKRNDVAELVEAIRPLLAGFPAPVQGAVLADLLAIWLAGHFGSDAAKTAEIREMLLEAHNETVRRLIPENEEHILTR